MDADIDPLTPESTLQQVTRHLATYNLVAVPVVDDNDRLLGAVSVDDVIDHLLPEDWRDRDELPADAALTTAAGAMIGLTAAVTRRRCS